MSGKKKDFRKVLSGLAVRSIRANRVSGILTVDFYDVFRAKMGLKRLKGTISRISGSFA